MENEELSKIIARIEKLEKAVFGGRRVKKDKSQHTLPVDIDFSLNERAFIKRYASKKSGPEKFTILLAHLVRGNVDKEIEISEITKHWSKMSAKNLLGKFNRFYSNDAKTKGWVDSKKRGSYKLTKEWENAL